MTGVLSQVSEVIDGQWHDDQSGGGCGDRKEECSPTLYPNWVFEVLEMSQDRDVERGDR